MEKRFQFLHRTFLYILYHAQGGKTVHIQFLTRHVELFKVLLAGRVTPEVNYRINLTVFGHLGGKLFGFLVRGAFLFLITQRGQETVANGGEGHHFFFTQLREEDFPVMPQDTGQHADLPAFFRGNKVTSDITRSGQGLFLHDAFQETGQQGAVGKSDIGKSCRGHLELRGIGHDHVLHDAFAGSHDVYRIGCLVRRDTEEMPGRIFRQQIQQLLRFDDVVLYQCLYGIFIFFATHVFMG